MNAKIGGVYHIKVVHKDGSVTDYGKKKNIITNVGFNFLFTTFSGSTNLNNVSYASTGLQILLDSAQTKLSTQQLTIPYTITFTRL